ncbi:MAG: HDOD domain-containing protein [Dehalococcoidia bacterium]|nr:HDOD domain-containing protein [Dehalococcoidia bacterium]
MASLAELAAVVETDPAAAAAILRAANSVASAPADRIGRVGEAIVRMGIEDTRSILVALMLRDASGEALERSGLDLDELWRHLIH